MYSVDRQWRLESYQDVIDGPHCTSIMILVVGISLKKTFISKIVPKVFQLSEKIVNISYSNLLCML